MPLSAVTVTFLTFSPTLRLGEPVTLTDDFESALSAEMVHVVTLLGTFTLYEVTLGEKDGERVPDDTLIAERSALVDALSAVLFTVTVVDAEPAESSSMSILYTSVVDTLTDVLPDFFALNFSLQESDSTPDPLAMVRITVPPPPLASAPEHELYSRMDES